MLIEPGANLGGRLDGFISRKLVTDYDYHHCETSMLLLVFLVKLMENSSNAFICLKS